MNRDLVVQSEARSRLAKSAAGLGIDVEDYVARAVGTYIHMLSHAARGNEWLFSEEHFSGLNVGIEVSGATALEDEGLDWRISLPPETLSVIDGIIQQNRALWNIAGIRYQEVVKRALGVYECLIDERGVKKGASLSGKDLEGYIGWGR